MWNAADESPTQLEPDEVKPEWKLHSLVARYLDLVEKKGSEWRFLSRRLIYDWSRVDTVPAPLINFAPESPRSIVPSRTGSHGVELQ